MTRSPLKFKNWDNYVRYFRSAARHTYYFESGECTFARIEVSCQVSHRDRYMGLFIEEP